MKQRTDEGGRAREDVAVAVSSGASGTKAKAVSSPLLPECSAGRGFSLAERLIARITANYLLLDRLIAELSGNILKRRGMK